MYAAAILLASCDARAEQVIDPDIPRAARARIAIGDGSGIVSTTRGARIAEGASHAGATRAISTRSAVTAVGGASSWASWRLDQQARQVRGPGRIRSQGGRGHDGGSAQQGKGSHNSQVGSLHVGGRIYRRKGRYQRSKGWGRKNF